MMRGNAPKRHRRRPCAACLKLRPGARFLTLTLGLFIAGTVAFAEAPSVSHIFPAGGQRGTQLQVTCTGKFSHWPVSIWAPGLEIKPGSESGKLELTIPADLAADRVWIRLYDTEGAATALPFLIGGLPEAREREPNNAPLQAQLVEDAQVTMNGVLEGADVDGFAVKLDAGQTLVADVDAYNQLGSPMDAILQIASPAGIVLADNHDDVDLDPRLAFTADSAGTYHVRLFAFSSTPDTSIAFHGGANYVYRLTLTTGPYVAHASPLAAMTADRAEVTGSGWNLSAPTRLPVVPFGRSGTAGLLEVEPLADRRNSSVTHWGFAFAPGVGGGVRVRFVPYPALEVIESSL
ncbi:MAG: PPC domain-containing protein, partial [Pirellulaceae bacterium]